MNTTKWQNEFGAETATTLRLTHSHVSGPSIASSENHRHDLPGDQEGLFKLAAQLRKIFHSVIYNTATGYVLLVYLTNI
jgi:hypothetical protein